MVTQFTQAIHPTKREPNNDEIIMAVDGAIYRTKGPNGEQMDFLDEIIRAIDEAATNAVAERQLNIVASVFAFLNATRNDPHLIVGIGCSREEWDELSEMLAQKL